MTVTGSASMAIEGHTGTDLHEATTFSMGNQLTFSGSGELDNGMTVSLSFVMDHGDPGFDGHSVTVSSDSMGTLAFHGEGGSSSASAIDGAAAGDMWDNFNSNGGTTFKDSSPGDNSLMYTLPTLVDGLSANVSYNPQISSGKTDEVLAATSTGNGSEIGYGVTYTGVEGLSVSYGVTDLDRRGSTALASQVAKGDQTSWKASYAYGSITVAASNSEYDITGTTSDQELSSMKVSYTVSDAISIGYGTEEISVPGSVDAEFEGISASYTAGGMTLSANMQDGKNIGNSAASGVDYWGLGLAFAF
jgi:outer membrane protein OmpU